MVREGVPREIGGADFESGDCDLLEYTYVWVCGMELTKVHLPASQVDTIWVSFIRWNGMVEWNGGME